MAAATDQPVTLGSTGAAGGVPVQAPSLTSLPDVPGGGISDGAVHPGGDASAGLGDDTGGSGGMTALEMRLANLRS